jgi:hypothetical protein
VVCYSTDTTKPQHLAREAFTFNPQTSDDFNVYAEIGSYSSSGAWWAFNSDWWCTLGNRNSGTSTGMACGLQFQPNAPYSAGDMVSCTSFGAACQGRVFVAANSGISGATGPSCSGSMASATCPTMTSGTVTFNYVSMMNALMSVFIVKLE